MSTDPSSHARVVRVDRTRIVCLLNERLVDARVPKRLRDDAPCVGDVVDLEPPAGSGPHVVRALLPRRSLLARRAAGQADVRQPLAANVDLALVATAVDEDYSERRIERYLALCAEASVPALVLLTKADLLAGPPPAPHGEHLLVSAATGQGMDALRARLAPGTTAALLGSSGVGKSTLVNALLGEARMRTAVVREGDHKGRHTTTHREMLRLPWGAWLIDAPGLREVGVMEDASGAFDDVESLARACRFSDCRHETEPGCAVRARVEPERLASWRALQAEAARVAKRADERASRAEARSHGRMGRDAMRAKDFRRRGL